MAKEQWAETAVGAVVIAVAASFLAYSLTVGGKGAAHGYQVQAKFGQVGSLALYGMGLDEINRYINNVQAITTADIQKFAGTRLDAKTSNIIIVGNAKVFLPELQKKFPNVEVIPIGDLDLNTALLKKKQAAG